MPEVMTFWHLQSVFKKVTYAGLNSLQQKRFSNSKLYFMILPKYFFSKHRNKAEFKNPDDSGVLSSGISGLRASAAPYHQRTCWTWWLDHPWYQNHQYWSLFVEWIIKNPIFHWYLIPFLSETVEASLCYFF